MANYRTLKTKTMDLTHRQIMESDAYPIQKAIISREINWGAKEYKVDQKEFKKIGEEKDRLKYLKKKWLKIMRDKYPDFTRKTGGKKKFRQTLVYGEDI